MEDGKTASPPGAEGGEEEDDFGYRLFPDRNKEPQSFLVRSLFTFHNRCQVMLRMTLETNPYAQLLIAAMKQSGCTVFNDRHFSCENCDGCVSGGFDSATSQNPRMGIIWPHGFKHVQFHEISWYLSKPSHSMTF